MQKADSEGGGSPLIGGCLFKECSSNNLAKQTYSAFIVVQQMGYYFVWKWLVTDFCHAELVANTVNLKIYQSSISKPRRKYYGEIPTVSLSKGH